MKTLSPPFICTGCGNQFRMKSRDRSRWGKQKYCGQECFNHYGKRRQISECLMEKIVKGASPDECWGWTGSICPSKKRAKIRFNGSSTNASRVSWFVHCGEIPPGQWVLHTCDNGLCTNPKHLFLGNHKENMEDMARKGRRKGKCVGEDSGQSVLTEKAVLEIRQDNRSTAILAKIYGASKSAIQCARYGRTWRHLPGTVRRKSNVTNPM